MVGLVHIIFTEYLSDNKSQKECKIGFNYETESSSWKKKKKMLEKDNPLARIIRKPTFSTSKTQWFIIEHIKSKSRYIDPRKNESKSSWINEIKWAKILEKKEIQSYQRKTAVKKPSAYWLLVHNWSTMT